MTKLRLNPVSFCRGWPNRSGLRAIGRSSPWSCSLLGPSLSLTKSDDAKFPAYKQNLRKRVSCYCERSLVIVRAVVGRRRGEVALGVQHRVLIVPHGCA